MRLLQGGFTMIEFIVVIVVLSILSVGSVQFISYSAQGYVDTVRRSELAASAMIANEKISRMMRAALPGSVRLNSDKSCVEFIPLLAATQYLQAPIVGNISSLTQVTAVPIDPALPQTGYLAIYPLVADSDALYNDTLTSGFINHEVATISTPVNGASVFTFSSFQFLQASPQKRLFITSQPVTFCQKNSALYFYRNYGFVGAISNLDSALPTSVPKRLLVCDQLKPRSLVFNYLPSSLRRNSVLSFQMEFIKSNSTESLFLNQEVQIRNVP